MRYAMNGKNTISCYYELGGIGGGIGTNIKLSGCQVFRRDKVVAKEVDGYDGFQRSRWACLGMSKK